MQGDSSRCRWRSNARNGGAVLIDRTIATTTKFGVQQTSKAHVRIRVFAFGAEAKTPRVVSNRDDDVQNRESYRTFQQSCGLRAPEQQDLIHCTENFVKCALPPHPVI
eukprot:2563377-Pleurochrysis_carterae.AAC.1